MASLYEEGWRQGSIFEANLPLHSVVLTSNGEIIGTAHDHGRWVVATQDCDLALTDCEHDEPSIELRAVHAEHAPPDWGIRSSRFRLTNTAWIASADPRLSVAAAALTALRVRGVKPEDPTPARARAFAIWLGLRYDRPALPTELLPLARRIAEEARRRQGRIVAAGIRDVLMQFDERTDPIRYSLFAVVDEAATVDDAREWLAGIASRVPTELGLADEIEAATAERTSFRLIETSYPADVSRLTWPPNDPEPTGA